MHINVTVLEKIVWFLNRAAAGIVTAALTGAFAGLVLFCYVQITGGPPGPGADITGGFVWIMTLATIGGTILGSPSGILVMCLSRAKKAPWRSIPILLIGTTLGVVILGLPWGLLPGTTLFDIILKIMIVAGPTLGGLLAVHFLLKEQEARYPECTER